MGGLRIEGSLSGNIAEVSALKEQFVTIQPIITTVTISTSNGIVSAATNGLSSIGVQILSVGTGGVIVFEGSGDNVNWAPLSGLTNGTQVSVTGTSVPGAWQFDGASVPYFRIRATALTSGTITGVIVLTANNSVVMLEQGLVPAALTGIEGGLVVRDIPISSPLAATATAAANTGATLTLNAAGAGLFHYITHIEITRTATAALAGTATLVVTSTNLPGSLAWSYGNAMAAGGTQKDTDITFYSPLKSSVANTATTIVMPAPGLGVLWRATAFYYTGT